MLLIAGTHLAIDRTLDAGDVLTFLNSTTQRAPILSPADIEAFVAEFDR